MLSGFGDGLASWDFLVPLLSSDFLWRGGRLLADLGRQLDGVSSDTLVRLASGLIEHCVKKQRGLCFAWLSTLVCLTNRVHIFFCSHRYNSLVTGQRAKGIIAVCWVLSIIIGLTPMLGWNKSTERPNSTCSPGLMECLFEEVVVMDYMVYFNFFACVLMPLLLMLVIYLQIFMAARHQLKLIELKAVHGGKSHSTLQKEVQAAKSLAIIVGLFAICWLPLHIINCFTLFCQDCGRPHIWVMNIAIILSHANSVVNPFIYAYRIREFRHTFRRILRQHVLGHQEWNGGDRGVGGSISVMRTTTRINMVDGSCGTMMNSYALEPSPKLSPTRTPIGTHRAEKEASSTFCQWSPPRSDPAPISYIQNGYHSGDAPLSLSAVQSGVETKNLGGTTEVMEVTVETSHLCTSGLCPPHKPALTTQ